MRRFAVALLIGTCWAQAPTLTIPSGTKVDLALTSPIWAKWAKPGDNVYAETAFPVAVTGTMGIPTGTYVEGRIDILVLPRARSGRAEFRMHFTHLIFANGYAVALPESDAEAALSTDNVLVSSRSDVWLDRGSQIEMILESPLTLDAAQVAAAVQKSKAPDLAKWKSATRCRPTRPAIGTSDTVIPGTPGTPSTTVPGGPGMAPIVIPGTPGTPATVIPGSPGFPGVACPAPPAVVSTPIEHRLAFQVVRPISVGGTQLSTGSYEARFEGLGPVTQVRIMRHGQTVAALPAHVVALGKTAGAGEFAGDSLQFRGENFALRFDPGK